jgi:RNA polymerase sigma-70 factor (ECF subfamily)
MSKEGDLVTDKGDAQLVEACLEGDRAAYAELIRRHAARVYAVCLAIAGTSADAEDLAQEALVKGFMELDSLRDRERFGAWVATIATNLSRNFARTRANQKRLLAAMPDCPRPDAESSSAVRRMLWRLPERERILLMLYYFENRSTESIAATLGISTAAVHTRLCRARGELRKLIEKSEARNEK